MTTQGGVLSDEAEINPKHRNGRLKQLLSMMRLNVLLYNESRVYRLLRGFCCRTRKPGKNNVRKVDRNKIELNM